jgi:hypothetical protein
LRDASKKLGGELSSDLYIDGAWRTGTGRDLIDVIDPYDNQWERSGESWAVRRGPNCLKDGRAFSRSDAQLP